MIKTKQEKITENIQIMIMLIGGLAVLLPILNVTAKSFSSESAVLSGNVLFWPRGFQIETYIHVFTQGPFFRSFFISVLRTLFGAGGALIITVMTAYPLSQKNLKGRKVFLFLWLLVMIFKGGIIPNYMLYKSLNLTNSFGSLILPQLVNVFNLLIIKNYMEGIPESLREAAKIDGARESVILFKIIIPVSMPVIATICLFYAVEYWNDYFFAMLYNSKPSLKPLQHYLFDLITESMDVMDIGSEAQSVSVDSAMNLTAASVRSAAIVASTMPILLVYPYLQRYFVKGIVIGSVKG